MSSIKYIVVLLFLLDCATQPSFSANLTCDQLPKLQFPSIKTLIANSPLVVDYSLTCQFDCSTMLYSSPARGTKNYIGNVVFIKGGGSEVYVLQYKLISNGTIATVVLCATGRNDSWYFGYSSFDEENGSFYCAYICDGPAIKECICVSNNDAVHPQEAEFLALARQVEGGDQIHRARSKCLTNDCSDF